MECFKVYSNEIKGRLDPYYYKPEFIQKYKQIHKSKSDMIVFANLITDLKNGVEIRTYSDSGYRYLRVTDLDEFGINNNNPRFVSVETVPSKIKITNQDILISRSGSLGLVSIVTDEIINSILSSHIFKVSLNTAKINPRYLEIYLRSPLGQFQFFQKNNGGIIPEINQTALKSLIIILPNLDTQNKIISLMYTAYAKKKAMEQKADELLNSIDDYVLDQLGIKMPELKDRQCYAVNSQEITGRVAPYYYQPKFKEIEQSLQNGKYQVEKLKKFITKIHYGVSVKNVYVDEGIPLLRILNLKPNKINLSEVVKLEESKRKEIGNGFVYKGDLLISRSGSVEIVAVVPKEADGFAFGSFMIKFCLTDKINKEFVSIWLNNKFAQLFTMRERIGAVQGNITIETIENFNIPCPPPEIQSRIADEVKDWMDQARKLKAEAVQIIDQAKAKVEKIILGK